MTIELEKIDNIWQGILPASNKQLKFILIKKGKKLYANVTPITELRPYINKEGILQAGAYKDFHIETILKDSAGRHKFYEILGVNKTKNFIDANSKRLIYELLIKYGNKTIEELKEKFGNLDK